MTSGVVPSGHVADLEFTCPNCGSHHFGTSVRGSQPPSSGPITQIDATPLTDEAWLALAEGMCNGYREDEQRCNFAWPRAEDAKYFKSTGTTHPRTVIEEAP